MTPQMMETFIAFEKKNGASVNMIRRFSRAINALYDFLPEDKQLTKDRLVAWRTSLEENNYSSATILNYIKYINRFLDYMGCSDIRFNRGQGKDIAGMTFGYLTAIEPTDKRERKNIIWRCKCQCGNEVELPATRLLVKNTLSCGCLTKEYLQRANKYIDHTSLRQALKDDVKSSNAKSGYTGVREKRDKWQAYITYKGVKYNLGCYLDIKDAIEARAKAKELVQQDALELLEFYEEALKNAPPVPTKRKKI